MQARRRGRAENQADHLKGRIAEALVEGMFMRAGYAVSRVGRESQVPRLFKAGRDDFIPDFMVRKAVERAESDRPLHRLIPVEVKYRHDIPAFLRRHGRDFFERARGWRDLCVVIVTDNPEPDRSCFQVVDFASAVGTTCDLAKVRGLDIYPSTVREYEHLVQKLFAIFDDR
jgi:hypothetical protein